MQGFIGYFRQYWYLFLILIVLLFVTLIVFRKAAEALARTKAEKEKLIKKLEHMKMIRETYSDLTKEKILEDDGEYLLEGIADNIQMRLEKTDDMNAAFEELKKEEKLAYALHYFLDEAKVSPSQFFKAFSRPLTPYAVEACKEIVDKKTHRLITEMFDSYDEENESSSVIPEKIEELDEKIKEKLDIDEAKIKAADFIKKNVEKFI